MARKTPPISEEIHTTPRRAERILNKLVADKALSKAGKDWIVAALDPFHDSEIRVEGHPDIDSSRSVVQVIQNTFNVSYSGSAKAFDCSIFFLPTTGDILDTTASGSNTIGSVRPGTIQAPTQVTQGSGAFLYGGWNVMTTDTGVSWAGGTAIPEPAAGLPLNFLQGNHRIIGSALEVVNTTAQLYKGGAVTAYKEPAKLTHTVGSNDGHAALPYGNQDAIIWDMALMPPTSSSNAANYPNSRTWSAEDGCYLVATLNDVDNPVDRIMANRGFVSVAKDYSSGIPAAPMQCYYTSDTYNIGATAYSSSTSCSYPFDNTGAFFTGLNPNTTLQVTTKYLVEFFPTALQPVYQSLATPSAPYDPLALELYSRCMREMPCAVPQTENPLGEWFSALLEKVGEWAPKVGAVFGPAGSVIGNGLGMAAKAGSSLLPTLRQSIAPFSTSQTAARAQQAKAKSKKKRS